MKRLGLIFMMLAVICCGCPRSKDDRVYVRDEVGSDSLISNVVTRPVTNAFSALIGEGIEIRKATTRRNDAGFLEVYVEGYNRAPGTKRFRYKVDWLDEDIDPRPNSGAEDDYYMLQNPPYRAANRLMASASELRLVKGMI